MPGQYSGFGTTAGRDGDLHLFESSGGPEAFTGPITDKAFVLWPLSTSPHDNFTVRYSTPMLVARLLLNTPPIYRHLTVWPKHNHFPCFRTPLHPPTRPHHLRQLPPPPDLIRRSPPCGKIRVVRLIICALSLIVGTKGCTRLPEIIKERKRGKLMD